MWIIPVTKKHKLPRMIPIFINKYIFRKSRAKSIFLETELFSKRKLLSFKHVTLYSKRKEIMQFIISDYLSRQKQSLSNNNHIFQNVYNITKLCCLYYWNKFSMYTERNNSINFFLRYGIVKACIRKYAFSFQCEIKKKGGGSFY